MTAIFDELLARGRAMTEKQRVDTLRALASDPRFPALLGMLDELRESSIEWQAQVNAAEQPARLAYGAGVIGALQQINAILRQATEANPADAQPSAD